MVLCAVASMAMAQKAQLKVGYTYDFFDPRGIEKRHDYILLAGNGVSKFYNHQTQWLDSVRCTEEGERWYAQQGLVMMGELMNRPREEREAILNSSSLGRPVSLDVQRKGDVFTVGDEKYGEHRKYTGRLRPGDWPAMERAHELH